MTFDSQNQDWKLAFVMLFESEIKLNSISTKWFALVLFSAWLKALLRRQHFMRLVFWLFNKCAGVHFVYSVSMVMCTCTAWKRKLFHFSINLLVVYRESVNLIGYITRRLSADSLQLWIANENRLFWTRDACFTPQCTSRAVFETLELPM